MSSWRIASPGQAPEIGNQKTLKIVYLFTEKGICAHLWPGVNVVDTIQSAQRDGVAQKMVPLEGGAHAKQIGATFSSAGGGPLHIMKEYGHNRYIALQALGEQILIEEYLVNSIFARRFDRADDFRRVDIGGF